MVTATKWALLDAQSHCVNVVTWDGDPATWQPPSGLQAVAYDPAVHVITPDPTVVTAQTLQQRASAALASNVAFLAIATPTNAQVVNQVQALTKECTAVIRLLLGQLDSTSGT